MIRNPGAEVTDEFLKWERRLDGRPFFAFLNYYDAHGPYRSPMRTAFDSGRTPQDRYDGALRYIDSEIARLVDSLRASGTLDHCLLVIASDHGEQFGEHGLSSHGNSLYLPVLHVPLLIRLPDRAAAGTHIATAVSLSDLGATLAALSRLRGANTLAGTSLDIPGNDAGAGGRAVIAELSRAIGQQALEDRNRHGGLTALLNDTLHVIRDDATGSIEAYRYRSDEGEKNDLARSDVERATASRLLQEALRREGIVSVKQP